jgi:hypothetical protein
MGAIVSANVTLDAGCALLLVYSCETLVIDATQTVVARPMRACMRMITS